MKYVIWGTGERARRLMFHMNMHDVICFVDTRKQIDNFLGKEVISLEDYEKKYLDYPIVISFYPLKEEEALLRKKGIYNYFVLADCPGEFQTSNLKDTLKKYVIEHLEENEKYYIYGNNLYALFVYDWVNICCNKEPMLLIDSKMSSKKRASIERIGYKWIRVDEFDEQGQVLFCDYVTKELKCKLLNNPKIHYLFDISMEIEEYHNKKIEKFKNLHNNQKCFVVATGPSLLVEDLEKLRKENIISISMNQIWKIFANTDWRPNYYIADDPKAIEMVSPQFEKYSIDNYFIGDTWMDFEKTKHPPNVYLHHLNYEFVYNRLPDFSEDFSRQCYLGATVTYSCIQLAVYMGFKEIYLLGVDFSYGNSQKIENYGHCYEEKEMTSKGLPNFVRSAYTAAKLFADSHDIKIYNATRGGNLDVFERVEFDLLFSENNNTKI